MSILKKIVKNADFWFSTFNIYVLTVSEDTLREYPHFFHLEWVFIMDQINLIKTKNIKVNQIDSIHFDNNTTVLYDIRLYYTISSCAYITTTGLYNVYIVSTYYHHGHTTELYNRGGGYKLVEHMIIYVHLKCCQKFRPTQPPVMYMRIKSVISFSQEFRPIDIHWCTCT